MAPPSAFRRRVVPLLKGTLAAVILFFIGRQFYRDLTRPEVQEARIHLGWLALSAVLYLAGLVPSALFWKRLLHLYGHNVSFGCVCRAYFIGHLGKYAPGKAWALLLRGELVREAGAPLAVSIITAFYEVLTTMAAGALIASVVFFLDPPILREFHFPPYVTGLFLLAGCGLPLLPVVFNYLTSRMARKLTARVPSLEHFHAPRMRFRVLLSGLTVIAVGWGLFGLSVWAALAGVLEEPPPLTLGDWAHYCGVIGLAYVMGFLAFVLPSGVGVREWVLTEFLHFAGPRPVITLGVLMMRIAWTLGELVVAAKLAVRRPAGPRRNTPA